MTTQVEWEFSEKPLFCHRIAGLSIGAVGVVIGPVLSWKDVIRIGGECRFL